MSAKRYNSAAGEHPTTRLCLKEISAQADLTGKHVIDYGTGSGVLALTALRMGKLSASLTSDGGSQRGTHNANQSSQRLAKEYM